MSIDPVSLAIAVALNAASMAITASRTIEGPRLTDLNVTVADYGTPLTYLEGQRRVETVIFYAEPIREQKQKRKTKGGKYNEYTYFGTWAAMVCDNAVDGYIRIWFDRHLVYDATDGGTIFPIVDGINSKHDSHEGQTAEDFCRFYYGSETQEPDPRMMATVEADEGVGMCPAYLGVSYIFFEEVPLEKIGNRFPMVSAEVGTGGSGVVIDFENGIYSINGISRPIDEVIQPSSPYTLLTYTGFEGYIIEGVGLRISGQDTIFSSSAGLFYLTHEAFSAATAGDPGAGVTGSATFTMDGLSVIDSSGTGQCFINVSMFTASGANAYFWHAAWRKPPAVGNDSELYQFGPLGGVGSAVSMAYGDGDHVAGFTLSEAELSLQIDSEAETVVTPVSAIDPLQIRIYVSSPAVPASSDHYIIVKRIAFSPVARTTGTVTSASTSLGAILSNVAARVGMDSTDYDFSQLTQEISGYSWTQGTAKEIVSPLLELYDSLVRGHGFQIEGVRREVGVSYPTVTSDWFVRDGSNPLFEVTTLSETDLPRRIFLNFADINGEQQPNSAVSQRNVVSTLSTRELSVDMTTWAAQADEAQPLVERMLRRRWMGAVTGKHKLTPKEMALEPGDAVNVLLDGDPITARFVRTTIAPNRVIQCFWERDSSTVYVAPASPGAEVVGRPTPSVFNPVESTGFVLDIPLLTDAQDQGTPFVYVAAGPVLQEGDWPGTDFWLSDSGVDESFVGGWDSIGYGDGVTWGTTESTVPDALPQVIDEGTELYVTIAYGELYSVTEDEMLNDGSVNLALVGDELIQFRDATLQSAGGYLLTGLMRGCRGTEQSTATHIQGERFVLISSVVKKHDLGASKIGDTDYYKYATISFGEPAGDIITVAFSAAANRPYAPAHVELVRDTGTGDWTITWTRRSRIGGSTINGQDVPLGESSELYRVKIMSGATVVRTIEVTAETATYTSAQQTTDWGSPQTTLSIQVLQVSPTLSLEGFATSAQA